MQDCRPLRNFLATCLWDIRYTFRKLGRDPGFAAVSILILALAIGANIAVFSVVNTLLLRPLPFPNSNELVWIAATALGMRMVVRNVFGGRVRRIPRP